MLSFGQTFDCGFFSQCRVFNIFAGMVPTPLKGNIHRRRMTPSKRLHLLFSGGVFMFALQADACRCIKMCHSPISPICQCAVSSACRSCLMATRRVTHPAFIALINYHTVTSLEAAHNKCQSGHAGCSSKYIYHLLCGFAP